MNFMHFTIFLVHACKKHHNIKISLNINSELEEHSPVKD